MKNSLRNFFGPRWMTGILKLVLSLAFYYLVIYLESKISIDYQTLGLPLRILTPCTPENPGNIGLPGYNIGIVSSCYHQSYIALILNGVFWYAITSFVINLFIKNKK